MKCHCSLLGQRFLQVVFAEGDLTRLGQHAQGVGGLGFRHGHQGHVGGITSRRTAGARHAMPYVSQSGMGVHKRLAGVVAAG